MSKPHSDDLHRRYNEAFGRTIREWASLELILITYLEAFLPVDQFRLRIIWLHLPNWDARRRLLMRLAATYLDGRPLRCLTILMKRASKLAAKRNLIAHAGAFDVNTDALTFANDAGDPDLGTNFLSAKRFQLANIENWPDDIKRLRRQCADWLPALQAAVHTLPKMHREGSPDPSSG